MKQYKPVSLGDKLYSVGSSIGSKLAMGAAAAVVAVGLAMPAQASHCVTPAQAAADNRITLYDLGMLQLAAHDAFKHKSRDMFGAYSRDSMPTRNNDEDGLLNLSTVWNNDPRNKTNIILFTAHERYRGMLDDLIRENGGRDNTLEEGRGITLDGKTIQELKSQVVGQYHVDLRETYERVFEEPFPEPKEGSVTINEAIALRILHDYLPVKINVGEREIIPTHSSLFGKTLTDEEMQQMSGPLDGVYGCAYHRVRITMPDGKSSRIDLHTMDHRAKHISDINPHPHFADLLKGNEDGELDDLVKGLIRDFFARAMNFKS